MTATQMDLVEDPVPPSLIDRGIDLRCCNVLEMLPTIPSKSADLIIADPPWKYSQKFGASSAEDYYPGVSCKELAEHLNRAWAVSRRLVLWIPGPILGEWMDQKTAWKRPVTMGAWTKSGLDVDGEPNLDPDSGFYGQGYHWAGCAEFVLVYAKGAYTDRSVPLRSCWNERPNEHSRKPVRWMQQWVRRWSPPGGLVVEMYAGLGSGAEAVMRAGEGRRYIGAEIDAARHKAALGLLAQVRP